MVVKYLKSYSLDMSGKELWWQNHILIYYFRKPIVPGDDEYDTVD